MSNVSIKKNFFYNAILTVSNYIFPLLTFPYVTRVLGVEHLGIYNFVESSIQYFITLSLLGINATAIREIVRTRSNRQVLSETFSSLLLMVLCSTLLSLAILFVCIQLIPKFYVYKGLFYIGAVKILFSALLVEWLYSGLENFRYITIRSIIVKLVYVLCVFLFVQDTDDYALYFLLTVLLTVGNAILNLIYSRKFLTITFRNIDFRPYISSFLVLGIYQICTSLYNAFNVLYLGIVSDEIQVGYYSVAVRLYTIILALFTAFTGVMIPRKTALLTEGRMTEFLDITYKSVDVLLAFVVPTIVVTVFYAPEIIRLIAGPGYEGSVVLMRMLMPLMFIIGYEQIIITQTLLPIKKDRAILINSILGGSVALSLNYLLVSHLQSVGSAIVWIVCELVVLCSGQYFVKKYINLNFPYIKVLKRILAVIPLFPVLYYYGRLANNIFVNIMYGGVFVFSYYLVLEFYIFHNSLLKSSLRSFKIWGKLKSR